MTGTGEWRADPVGRHEYRYWDGTEWTEHVSDRGAVTNDPVAPNEVAPPPPPMPITAYPPPSAAAPAYYAPPKNNGLAIASMVLGIVWVYWIGSILAVIFGHIALSQIKKSQGAQRGRGMAIAGVVLGYVGIAVLVLVIVLAVTVGFDNDPGAATCRADAITLAAAETIYHSQHDEFGTESDLVSGSLIVNESDYHDIRVIDGGADYELVGRSGCA